MSPAPLADFFDSEAWLVTRNLLFFFLVVFWLAVGYWTYKAEVWNAKYEALDESVRAALDAAWESDRDEEEIRDEVEKTLESAGL